MYAFVLSPLPTYSEKEMGNEPVAEADRDDEIDWLRRAVYMDRSKDVPTKRITARDRFSVRAGK